MTLGWYTERTENLHYPFSSSLYKDLVLSIRLVRQTLSNDHNEK